MSASYPAPPPTSSQPSQRRISQTSTSTSSRTADVTSSAVEEAPTVEQNEITSPKDENSASTQNEAIPTSTEETAGPSRSVREDDDDVKKCWICFSDATEDTPESSPWRDPCPCALVAHEACLLDWIADIEAPNRGRARTIAAPRIECPQCKAEIQLARPRSYLVDAVRGLERWGGRLVTPGAITLLYGTLHHSSVAWGIHSVYAVFGAEDGFRILEPLLINRVRPSIVVNPFAAGDLGARAFDTILDHLAHWRLYVGLPMITPLLILSRTTIADSVLPVLPIVFFATQSTLPNDVLVVGNWPPSASLAFAILPYVRAAYNTYYRIAWAPKERRWLQEVQPRATSEQGNGAENAEAQGQMAAAQDNEDANIFEIRIDGGLLDEWEDEEDIIEEANRPAGDGQRRQQPAAEQAEPQPVANAAALPAGVDLAQDQPGVAHGQAQADDAVADAEAGAAGAERRLSFSPTAIAETVLGALLFPTIASISGEILRLALPRSWTSVAAVTTSTTLTTRIGLRTPARGMLQEKWGRSLVGGCLFVVLKDAVMLYVRWKMAQMHRNRHVLDYDRRKKKSTRSA